MNINYFMLILKSMIANYPVLREWGYVLGMPIVLAFDDMAEADHMLHQLSERIIAIDGTMNERAVRDAIQGTNSNAVVYYLDADTYKSQKNQKKLEVLDKLAAKGNINGCVSIVVVSAGKVPGDVVERYLSFYIDQSIPELHYGVADIVPNPESLELVKDKLLSVQVDDIDMKALYGAAYFMYPKLSGSHEKMYQRLIGHVSRIMDYADAYAESRDILNLVCGCFIKYAREGGFDLLRELPNLEQDDIDNKDTYAFIKENIVYISEGKLREIMKPINNVSISHIKAVLAANGMLRTDRRGGYSKKMQYVNPFGVTCRCRMLALDIDKIHTTNGEILSYEI